MKNFSWECDWQGVEVCNQSRNREGKDETSPESCHNGAGTWAEKRPEADQDRQNGNGKLDHSVASLNQEDHSLFLRHDASFVFFRIVPRIVHDPAPIQSIEIRRTARIKRIAAVFGKDSTPGWKRTFSVVSRTTAQKVSPESPMRKMSMKSENQRRTRKPIMILYSFSLLLS